MNMATPIKQVPILSGEIAEEFERLADERLKMPRRIVREMERQLREAVPTWRKN